MAMQLATVEQVKGYLSIGNVVDDALLERMLHAASGYIQTWITRSLGPAKFQLTACRQRQRHPGVAQFPHRFGVGLAHQRGCHCRCRR